MGRVFKSYLGGGIIYRCGQCAAHLALHDELISKKFQGRWGKGYLFTSAINMHLGPAESRMLTTGLHIVQDAFCTSCSSSLGWYYQECLEESQTYKEKKWLLEKERIIKDDLTSPSSPPALLSASNSQSSHYARSIDDDEED